MDIAGGLSFNDGIVLLSRNYYSVAKKKESGDIELDIAERNIPKLIKISNKIPLISGLISLLYKLFSKGDEYFNHIIKSCPDQKGRIVAGITFVIILLIIIGLTYGLGILLSFLFGIEEGSFLYCLVSLIPTMILLSCCLKLAIVAVNSVEARKFHGAEHKIINTHFNNLDFTDENIREQSKTSVFCGLNLVVNTILVFPIIVIVLYSFIDNFLLSLLIGYIASSCVMGEFIRLLSLLRDNKFTRAMSFFGIYLQNKLIDEPDQEHIDIAKVAMNALIEAESKTGD